MINFERLEIAAGATLSACNLHRHWLKPEQLMQAGRQFKGDGSLASIELATFTALAFQSWERTAQGSFVAQLSLPHLW